MSLSTQLVRLSDIKKTNTELRLHPPAQRKKARRLFERQGIVAPIILDERFNIIDGRLRFEIAQELGWKSLDCVVLHGLTEPQKRNWRSASIDLAKIPSGILISSNCT